MFARSSPVRLNDSRRRRERLTRPGPDSSIPIMRESLIKIARKGFFHIFGASTINRVLTALLGIVLVWIIPKDDYGTWGFANNIISFFVILNGLGAPSAILQLCSEQFKNLSLARSFYAFGARIGVLFDVLMAIAIFFVGLLVPMSVEGSNGLLVLYCLYPLVVLLCELRLTWLRTRRENRLYAAMTNVQTALLVLFSMIGAYFFSAAGLIIGQYVAYIVSFLVIYAKSGPIPSSEKNTLTKSQKDDYWSIAPISAINIGLSQALALVGTFLVGVLMVNAADVASYKVATTIPFALMFIPGVVMTFSYPYFAENRDDGPWTRLRYRQLTFCSLGLFASITVFFIVLAEPIIVLLFGNDYRDAVPPFVILMIGFFVNASFRNPAGNLLVTQRRLKWNLVTNVVSALVSIVLSVALIPQYGMVGAAWAYTASMAVAAFFFMGKYIVVIKGLGGRQ